MITSNLFLCFVIKHIDTFMLCKELEVYLVNGDVVFTFMFWILRNHRVSVLSLDVMVQIYIRSRGRKMIEFKYSEATEEALSELDRKIAQITMFYAEFIFPSMISQRQIDYNLRVYEAEIDRYASMKAQIISNSSCQIILSGEDAERFRKRLKDEGSIK